ncbi:MAG: L-glutamate gamma-semialdehyde dehydrogenase [Myxococcota bacterium]|nr:L-glutamate gamma-semialdehyde dehydrogenase [Myxococcota bacterium]
MELGICNPPIARNEPVKDYAPGSSERNRLAQTLEEIKATRVEIPIVIGGEHIKTGDLGTLRAPCDHTLELGCFHRAGGDITRQAIDAALAARASWMRMPIEHRMAIFLKAADIIAGKLRETANAVTMLSLGKTIHQAEIDAVCELADFWRFNVNFLYTIYKTQPISSPGTWNTIEWRPLEGFVFAVSPFNFASIAGNLPTAPAIMGNTVVWKPASTAVYPAWIVMQILEEAGLPPGVINFVPGTGANVGDPAMTHPDMAGVHFTGSTDTFRRMWQTISQHIAPAKNWPRIVGETGGKDFVFAHASANVAALSTALIRGAFEYQGQKCSAASRAYIPESMWPALQKQLLADVARVRVGNVTDFSNFMGAVIDEASFKNIRGYIEHVQQDASCEIIAGGKCDDSKGWYIDPTIILSQDPKSKTMVEEIFGPVLTIYVYPDERFAETLDLCNHTSPYALTGAVFARDRVAIATASEMLRDAAGNFYINDKPTGAVVGQQPFGGARASGTNDKAGSLLNLLRWASPRTTKETFDPPRDFVYPFMGQ